MKRFFKSAGFVVLTLALGIAAISVPQPPPRVTVPPPPKLESGTLRTGTIEVAKVFGRVPECENTDADFIQDVNFAAVRAGVDVKIAAATVAVESGCNPLAVSNRGAVGLMQIRVIAWKDKYDFSGRINLLNRRDNLQVGTEILAGLIKQFGVPEGVRRYQGLGTGGDQFYVEKILKLAGRKP